MSHLDTELVSAGDLTRTRSELGAAFPRILGYFREDGAKSIRAIEDAFRARSAATLVTPAHTLKGESAQFGAFRLSAMAEEIEMVARRCVEMHQSPDELIEVVVALRACFAETMALLDRDANPLAPRRPTGFGRRVEAPVQGFGRAI
ncbi:Hpt domain-containing protein [Sphingobium sp. CR2-8]|uniref:Hpt domain-containing protein n=1 Tax=Sphingobium sp. CR2-8 TaxID=1306534 RepID=UPI002DBDFA56|nr:Hpt domain-containing protein [Sphingobium sp. CR2-8]MEC3910599.1 Hpt domain-containing protein [Sphingobium sp. CR2-8]